MKRTMVNNPLEEKNKLIRIFELLLRQKWYIILTFLLVVSLVGYFTFTQQKMYSANASVIVDVVNITSGIGIQDFSGSASRNLQNELEILKSRNLKLEVAKSLIDIFYIDPDGARDTITVVRAGMVDGGITDTKDPRLPAYVAAKLGQITNFEMGKEKDIIEISAVSHIPKQAALIANVYAQTYYERDLRRSRSNATDVRQFLQDQTASRLDTLQASEGQLLNYMEDQNVAELGEKSKFLIMKMTDLESEIEKNQIELGKAKVLLSQYRDQLNALVPRVTSKIVNVDDLYITELQRRIATMEAELDVSRVINRADSSRPKFIREITRQQKTIDSLRSILNSRTNEYIANLTRGEGFASDSRSGETSSITSLSNKIQETQLNISTLQVSQENLVKSLNEYELEFNKIPKQQVTLARLQREKEFNEKLYLKLGEEYQAALLSELSTFGRVEILDEAVVPSTPFSPRYAINMAIAVFLGLLFGVFVAFAIDFFFSYVRSPHDVESLGFRLISTIPKLPENGSGRKLLGPKKDPNSRQLLEPSQSNLVAQESYQRLQIYLNYGFIDKEVKSLVVSSSGPGEGKSSTAANFAVTLANSGKKVLLVDMDLRKPVVHKFFDLPQTPTLIHYLYKKCELGDIIKKTSINNLFVVTAVEFNQNPALVFTSPALREFMDKMKTRFDFVIYDTPPVNAVTDAIHLARLVDETILIARADQTNVDELNRAAKLFEQFNINVGGVVLNDFDDAKLPSYYGRYYGFYTKDGVKIKKKRKKDKKDIIFDN